MKSSFASSVTVPRRFISDFQSFVSNARSDTDGQPTRTTFGCARSLYAHSHLHSCSLWPEAASMHSPAQPSPAQLTLLQLGQTGGQHDRGVCSASAPALSPFGKQTEKPLQMCSTEMLRGYQHRSVPLSSRSSQKGCTLCSGNDAQEAVTAG